MSIKDRIKNTSVFNKLKKTEFYWKIKNKIVEPPAHIYLTLKCNLKCPYCVNEANPKENKHGEYELASADQWIKAINRMNKDVAFTGGEPTLHPEFIEIINGINKRLNVIVYTNLVWSEEFTNRLVNNLKRPIKILASYHPSSGKPERILEVLKKLRERRLFEGTIHSVGTKPQEKFLEEKIRPYFKKHGFFLTIDKDQFNFFNEERCNMKIRKNVRCSGKSIIIAPDGTRYQCVSKMLRMKDPLENIFQHPLKKGTISSICPDYGFCSPCDMDFKIKEINKKPN